MTVLLAIFGLGVLMAVHEGGHFLLARLFKMRVIKYSIGFGPVLWSKKPEGSATTYQIALLPFLAYVQIAGMNPHDETDPNDPGSYANASWLGRFLTIVAGPLANYLLAVVIFFVVLLASGRLVGIDGLKVGSVVPKGAAEAAHVLEGDEVKSIAGKEVKNWTEMRESIQAHKGQEMDVVVVRNGAPVTLRVTPSKDKGLVGIGPKEVRQPVTILEAAKDAAVEPPKVAAAIVGSFYRLITLKEKPEFGGPPKIVDEMSKQFDRSMRDGVEFIAALSIYICVFNLLPFPALDGGRLAFLMYEFVARKRPDAKIEARVHMVGLLALLSLILPLFVIELWQYAAGFVKG